jgi:y4mF family transcriptional regulator
VNATKIPFGKIVSAADAGRLASARRKAQGLTQAELAGLGRIGTRFIGDLERGKATVQFDKALHVLGLLGLDVIVVERGS